MTWEEAIKWIDDRMCFGRGTFTEHHPPNIDECWQAGMMAIKALQREEAEEKGYCHRYLDKGLLMFLALSFPAPEEAPDDWFHHGDENLDAWRAYIMKCKERGYYDIPVEY